MKKILAILLILFSLFAFSQQEAMLSQYMFNNMLLNPASTGSREYSEVLALYRNQWSNINGAPVTAIICGEKPLPKYKLGLGLILLNEKIGANTRNDIHANIAYHLKITEKLKLAIGLKPGFSLLTSSFSTITVWESGDEALTGNLQNNTISTGSGIQLYSKKMFLGVSIPSTVYVQNSNFSTSRHFYLQGGYNYAIANHLTLKPSILLKYISAAPLQADINLSMVYNQQFFVGVSYRTKQMIIMLFQYQAGKNFKIGYSYDHWIANKLVNVGATHELMLAYVFIKNKTTIIDPRIF